MKNQDYGLLVVTISIERRKRIEHLMTEQDKHKTGLNTLTAQQSANLNEWFDPDKALHNVLEVYEDV
jgi:hypothetical protein